MLVCKECKSTELKIRGWIDPNLIANEPFHFTDFYWDTVYCTDCKRVADLADLEDGVLTF
jgi:hypothetical protein